MSQNIKENGTVNCTGNVTEKKLEREIEINKCTKIMPQKVKKWYCQLYWKFNKTEDERDRSIKF